MLYSTGASLKYDRAVRESKTGKNPKLKQGFILEESKTMANLTKFLNKALDYFAFILVLAMTCVVFTQVTNRYIFGSPLSWTEEAARILFIWMIFVGAYLALRMNAHISIESFAKRYLSGRTRERITDLFTFLITFFLCYLIVTSVRVLQATYEGTTPVLEISFAWVHLAIPLFTLCMIIYLIAQMFKMGLKRFVSSLFMSVVIIGVVYLLFGIATFSGPILVLVSVIGMGLLILFGMPIVFSMGIACLLFLALYKTIPYLVLHTRMIGGIDSFPLLAVPFFILAGELLNTGGVTKRLVDLAKVFVGHIRGGLGMVVVVAEYFFSGISGSTVADVSAIGALLVPAMKKAGYSSENTVSIVSAATAMGILVPPCIPMVVLGGMTGMSVGALFTAGFVPAIVLAICIMVLIYVQAVRDKIKVEERLSFKESMKAVVGAIIPLLCPVIIFGGILSGIATATEISVVAVLYAFIVGVFVYKEIKWSDVVPIFVRTAVTTGSVMLLVGFASVLSWILSTQQVPQMVAGLVTKISSAPFVFLLFCNLSFIVLGSVLEGLPAMLILVPIFLPFVTQFGIDPLHFGILAIASLGIGLFLPPVGMGIFIACTFAEIDVGKTFRSFAPYLVTLLIGLVIITAVPWFTLVLPRIFFK
ncbi:MAG TPA: TRAP transporter large permease subunit [Syntrophorhabdaceae bacterium]|nr:TRAP transporter large permease subunit [Syntrophorhabdaceae bacterium]